MNQRKINQEVLESLSKERKYTPDGILYSEPERRNDDMFQAFGQLGEFHQSDEKVLLYNGLHLNYLKMPAANRPIFEIPSERVIEYIVLATKE
jgi:hypothetical protein